jgi:hypothetical protein
MKNISPTKKREEYNWKRLALVLLGLIIISLILFANYNRHYEKGYKKGIEDSALAMARIQQQNGVIFIQYEGKLIYIPISRLCSANETKSEDHTHQ